MLLNLIKLIILIVVLVVVGYVGLSVWSSCARQGINPLDMPDEKEATHSVSIKNTGGLLLTSDYEQHGQSVGSRVFVLKGFWELRGTDFKYVDGQVVLDEAIFGEIIIKRRIK